MKSLDGTRGNRNNCGLSEHFASSLCLWANKDQCHVVLQTLQHWHFQMSLTVGRYGTTNTTINIVIESIE